MPHQCTGCGHTFADGSKEMLSGCPDCGGNTFQFRPEGAEFPDDPDASDPVESDEGESPPDADPAVDAEPPNRDVELQDGVSSVAETVGRATTKVRDFVSSGPEVGPGPDPDAEWPSETDESVNAADETTGVGQEDDIIDADARRAASASTEDDAQASARSAVVSPDELDGAAAATDSPSESVATDDDASTAGGLAAAAEMPHEELPATDGEADEVDEVDPDIAELREQLNDQFESIKIVEPGQYELNLMELYDREEYIIALQENGRYVIQVPEQWMGDEPGER